MSARDELLQLVRRELSQPVPSEALAVADRIRELYGSTVRGILFYGSCLRRGYDDGVLDLYVLVDSYRGAYKSRWLAFLNRVLPPNVFYLETPAAGRAARAKYAVLALDDLGRFTSADCFEPYFWARFAQPCALVYAADDEVRGRVVGALADAIATFVKRGVPLVAPRFGSRELWTTTWSETYRGELRPERAGVGDGLWANDSSRYEKVTELALRIDGFAERSSTGGAARQYEVQLSDAARRRALWLWRLRLLYGKVRFTMRMFRNGLIFEGGIDYVLWKIQRHSGIETDRQWRSKPHPLLALGAEAWRLYRAGAFR